MAASLLITNHNVNFFLKEISFFFLIKDGSMKVKDHKLQEYANLFYY